MLVSSKPAGPPSSNEPAEQQEQECCWGYHHLSAPTRCSGVKVKTVQGMLESVALLRAVRSTSLSSSLQNGAFCKASEGLANSELLLKEGDQWSEAALPADQSCVHTGSPQSSRFRSA